MVVAVEQQHDIVIIDLRIAEAVRAHVLNGHGERAGSGAKFVNLSAFSLLAFSRCARVMTSTLLSVPRANTLTSVARAGNDNKKRAAVFQGPSKKIVRDTYVTN